MANKTRKKKGTKEPQGAYSTAGPIGEVFRDLKNDERLQSVCVIGLGAGGALASYSETGQTWTFYEIDKDVRKAAEDPKQFTFLRDAKGKVRIEPGDARLRLQESKDRFGVLVVDAFNSEALPVHLVTREAAKLYREHLLADGLLVFNNSNRLIDLHSVLANIAADASVRR
jgi:spermidine synthase